MCVLTNRWITDNAVSVLFSSCAPSHGSGFTINNSIFSTLVMRYSKRDGSVHFDDYVTCCARLRTVFELFVANPKTADKKVMFDETSVSPPSPRP